MLDWYMAYCFPDSVQFKFVCAFLFSVEGVVGKGVRGLTFAIPTMQENTMVAIQWTPYLGPRDVQAKPKRPIVSRGASQRSHQRRASGLTEPGLARRLERKWWMEGR
jgi:hypothetical protein